MTSWFTYLLEVTVCQIIFYLVFIGFFRTLSFPQINRTYLLASTVISFIIPVISIPFWNQASSGISLAFTNLENFEYTLASPVTTTSGSVPSTNWLITILSIIYLVGLFLYSWKFYRGIRKILALVISNEINEYDGIKTIYLEKGPLFFAFLNYVFINKDKLNISKEEFRQVFDHEKVHIQQRHTLDNLLMELTILICWFNPIIRFMKRELNNVHEFHADQIARSTGNVESYSRLILQLSSNKEPQQYLTHQFSMNSIKKRIIMLNKKKSSKSALLRYMMIVPCLALLLVVFSFAQKSSGNENFVTAETTSQNISSITWKGNTLYGDEYLNNYMGIKKGDNFNEEAITNKLNYRPEGGDLAGLYMDQGYLFFRVEIKKVNNQGNVDLTFDMFEGDIVSIGEVFISGNNKVATAEILKMIDLKAGDLFSRGKLIASQKKIADSGLFDPEKVMPNLIPNIEDKTVDIEFTVQER